MGYLKIAHFNLRKCDFYSSKSGPNKKSKYAFDAVFNADYNYDTLEKWAISRQPILVGGVTNGVVSDHKELY